MDLLGYCKHLFVVGWGNWSTFFALKSVIFLHYLEIFLSLTAIIINIYSISISSFRIISTIRNNYVWYNINWTSEQEQQKGISGVTKKRLLHQIKLFNWCFWLFFLENRVISLCRPAEMFKRPQLFIKFLQ